MVDGEPLQRPARDSLVGMSLYFGLSYALIMFERQRRDRIACLGAAADAGEADDCADIGAVLAECSDLLRDVEIGFLYPDGRGHAHGKKLSRRSSAGRTRSRARPISSRPI